MNLYQKLIPEKIRIKIRNIQYRLQHFIFLFRYNFKKYFIRKTTMPKIKNKKPSIFYIIPTTKITGGVAICCEHLNRLQKFGFNTLFISFDNKTDLSWFPNQKIPIIPLKKAKKIIKNFDIGVATGWITAYELALMDVKRKVYFVQSDERRFYPEGSFLKKRVEETYKMNFEFLTEAKWIKDWLKKEFKKEAFYVPNGINTEIFYPDKPFIPKKKGIIRILVEGAADLPFKGVKEALFILNEIKKEIKNIEVVYVNSSGKPEKNWPFDYYFEKVPINKMKNIYSSCDFLLKLSKVEGFPGPPLEIIACGGIPIVLKTKGVEEYLENGVNGLILEKIDKEEIKRIILNKWKTIKNQQKIEKFSWEKIILKLSKFYSSEKLKNEKN